jgi:hypothetical protein
MQRALDVDAANNEGANSFPLATFQDSLDEKLNRMVSRSRLRLEEKYGPEPWGEQLHPYTSGGSFAKSEDRKRLLRIATEKPRGTLYESADYPDYVASRFTVEGMQWPRRFRTLTIRQRERIAANVGDGEAGIICRAALNAADALTKLCGYIALQGKLLELEPEGTMEREVLFVLSLLERAHHPCWELHPGMKEVKAWAERHATLPKAWQKRLKQPKASRARARQLVETQDAQGFWALNPALGDTLTQGEYWRTLLSTTGAGLLALNWQERR